ncbi:MAG TPA: hypothetical protein VH120_09200, partial [Gemmataceae bacterium]|nr:hypothetical protein [Gemmataceae bacterium]
KVIPGSTYGLSQNFESFWYLTFDVVRDAPDLDAQNRWGSPYSSVGLLAMADGSVRAMRHGVGYTVIVPLATPNGGEVVPANAGQ